jgi:hypothetical protein
MITVHLPVQLTAEFAANPVLLVEARTGSEMIDGLNRQYPGMASWLIESDGCFREHLSVFVAGRRLKPRANASIPLTDGSEIWILHAISGG